MILQNLEELESRLVQRSVEPVYLILGTEEFLCRKALALFKQKLLSQDTVAFNYAEFLAETDGIEDALGAAGTFPMMSPLRVVLFRGADRLSAGEQSLLIKYCENPSSKTVLVLTAGELDRRTVFYKFLKINACLIEFPKLKGYELERWAEKYLRDNGYKISTPSIKKMVDAAGSDLLTVKSELDKLQLFAGRDKNINDSMVDELVSKTRQHGIFDLTGALGRRDIGGALKHLGNLLDSGEAPLMIVTMMARHFRQILAAKELLGQGRSARDVAAAVQIPPFLIDEFLRQVQSLSENAARKMYLRLAELDLRIKSSSARERLLLENLICSL